MTVITREMKEDLIERIIANCTTGIKDGTAKTIIEVMRVQNFLIRNINYHGKFGKIECYTCYDDTDLNNLCIALQKIAETIKTGELTKIFENTKGYNFNDFETGCTIVHVVYVNKTIYAKLVDHAVTSQEKKQIIEDIEDILWIIKNWKRNNRII